MDGEQGILRYRGIPIEELADNSSFVETAWLVIFGRLPTVADRDRFSDLLTESSMMPMSMRKHFDAFPPNAHPMAILSAMINALSVHEPQQQIRDDADLEAAAARLLSKVRTIAAASYKSSIDEPLMYPRYDYKYVENFLHMMFSVPYKEYVPTPEVARALNLFLLLHADHEQNCSTSPPCAWSPPARPNLFASCAAGVCALWGPLHGGANVAVVEMLEEIQASGIAVDEYVEKVKNSEDGLKLMGFGHRGLQELRPAREDPQGGRRRGAQAASASTTRCSTSPSSSSSRAQRRLLHRAQALPERRLLQRASSCGRSAFPTDMFTVMFAIGRMPGWIANWKEIHDDPKSRIYRPRQIYVGEVDQHHVPRDGPLNPPATSYRWQTRCHEYGSGERRRSSR